MDLIFNITNQRKENNGLKPLNIKHFKKKKKGILLKNKGKRTNKRNLRNVSEN